MPKTKSKRTVHHLKKEYRTLIKQGDAALKKNNYALAMQRCEAALALPIKDDQALYLKARIYTRQEQFGHAIPILIGLKESAGNCSQAADTDLKSIIVIMGTMFSMAQRCFDNEQFAEAINICEEMVSYYPEDRTLLLMAEIASAHIEKKEYADAAYILEQLLNTRYKEQAEKGIAVIRNLVSSITPEEYAFLNQSLDKTLRPLFCTQTYRQEQNLLYEQHQQIQHGTYEVQINHIIDLMNFAFKYFQPGQKPAAFVDHSLQGFSAEKLKKRIHFVGNHAAKVLIPQAPPGQITQVLASRTQNMLYNLEDDIFLEDSMMIFRMIFESIHCLSRERRGQLSRLMPWKENSWYLLEFCSTFFHAHMENHSAFVIIPSGYDPDLTKYLYQFHSALQTDLCLVKVAIHQLIRDDLRTLFSFFESIQANLRTPATAPIKRLDELPALTTLLWYFKHTYQFSRLMSLLPAPLNMDPIQLYAQDDKPVAISSSIDLMLKTHTEETLKNSLKIKLAFLRRVQMTGEMLTNRGWGHHLDYIEDIEYTLLNEIRNSLSHPEEIASFQYIKDLESDGDRLVALYKECSAFKTKLYEVIANRQKQFSDLPNVDQPFALWKDGMSVYWDTVKKYYATPSFELNSFVSFTPLVNEAQYDKFRSFCDENAADYGMICSMLQGQMPLDLHFQGKLRNLLPSDKIGKGAEGALRQIYKSASKQYKQLRGAAEKKHLEKSKEEGNKRNEHRLNAMSSYPEISQVGMTSKQQFTDAQNRSLKVHAGELIVCLKDRFMALSSILEEAWIEPVKNLEQVRQYLYADSEAYFSCAYLIIQIVSVMNQLHRYNKLDRVDPRLSARLEDFVALRNALAHGDPVLESKITTFIHMQSKVIDVTASIAYELIDTFFVPIVEPLISTVPICSSVADPSVSPTSSYSSIMASCSSSDLSTQVSIGVSSLLSMSSSPTILASPVRQERPLVCPASSSVPLRVVGSGFFSTSSSNSFSGSTKPSSSSSNSKDDQLSHGFD